jgi:O-antigen biosynthesis protein
MAERKGGEPDRGLEAALHEPLARRLEVGRGTALFVEGRCSPGGERPRHLRLRLGGDEHPVLAHRMPAAGALSGREWWWAVIPVLPVDTPRLARLELVATLAGGAEAVAELGAIRLEPGPAPAAGVRGPERRLVAICMATYDPPLELFERQVASIREQTHGDWVCLVADDGSSEAKWDEMTRIVGGDERFRLWRFDERLGFYGNFERALGLVPPEATYVALADQDDRWHPEKLEALLGAIAPDVSLVYSDARVVSRAGRTLSETYWTSRRPGRGDLGSLLVSNTVSGAAALFAREVLADALPFPPATGEAYHDRWIALVAAALGRVAYLERPLYDYVQHPKAALGHLRANLGARLPGETGAGMLGRRLRRLRDRGFRPDWRGVYFSLVVRRMLEARVLELRLGARLEPRRRNLVARFAELERSPRAAASLLWRLVRSSAAGSVGQEGALLRAMAWRRLAGPRARLIGIREGLRRRGGRARRASAWPRAAAAGLPDAARRPLRRWLAHVPATRREAEALHAALAAQGPSARRATGPLVSIAIPNRNGRDHLERLLSALERTAYRPFEVIIVDNASSDGSVDYLERAAPGFPLSLIENDRNASFAEANNQAARTAAGELLLLLNNDVEPVTPDWLGHMVETLEDADAAAVGARLVYPRRPGLMPEGDAVHPDLSLQHRGVHLVPDPDGIPRGQNLGAGEDPLSPEAAAVRDVPAVTAACMLVRRDAYEVAGGLDEAYSYGTEDVDLCLRLGEGASRIVYDGRAVLYHHEFATQSAEGREFKRRNRARNRQLFVDRWGPRLYREVLLDRLRRERRWSEEPLHVAITVSRDDPRGGAGDYHTAHELGDALGGLGYRVSYLEQYRERWRQVDPSIEVVISLLEAFPLHEAAGTFVSVAWVRNWTERWVEQPWFEDYDLVFASSRRSKEIIEARTAKRAELLPLATNPARFRRTEPDPELGADLLFAGNHWGRDRELTAALPDAAAELEIKVFGQRWSSVPEVSPFDRGPLPYERLPAAYSSARIVLDDSAEHTRRYHAVNARVFDALACGAIVISNDPEGVAELFDDEFPAWHDGPSLRRAAGELLADPQRAHGLAERYRRMVLSDHTYERRAAEIRDRLVEWCEARRFGIAIGVPRRDEVDAWGDYHFARGIQRQLEARGHPTRVRLLDEWNQPASAREDVRLHLLGLSELRTRPGQLEAVWSISHPEKLTAALLDRYELAFIASTRLATQISEATRTQVRPLQQATDPERFFPAPHAGLRYELLFVGNSRRVRRRIVDDLMPTRHELAIFGRDWTPDLVDQRYVAGEHLPNRELNRHYSAAAIVLNDHWDEMRELGFLSNRLYDALACAACVVSDHVDGIEEEFGGAVTTYAGPDDLREKVDALLADPERRRELGAKGRREVLARHTFEHRVGVILDEVLPVLAGRPDRVAAASRRRAEATSVAR